MCSALSDVIRSTFSVVAMCLLVVACEGSPDSKDSEPADAEAGTDEPDAGPIDELDADLLDADQADADSNAATDDDAAQDAEVIEPAPCTVVAPRMCPDPPPRYPDVAPIIELRCAPCHSPSWTGPWPLDTYRHVADWQDTIREHLRACTMPPPDAGTPLPEDESMLILTWIRCGLPM